MASVMEGKASHFSTMEVYCLTINREQASNLPRHFERAKFAMREHPSGLYHSLLKILCTRLHNLGWTKTDFCDHCPDIKIKKIKKLLEDTAAKKFRKVTLTADEGDTNGKTDF